ncbi:MAG TPA: histidine phosphatase family protein [Blastocatellia bacterium]|nr:histidine phosphatase family protein [Blastocatellia bacterium]
MKTLLLLRHAKSSWDDASLRDFDRPLAPRGKKDAPRMGKALKERGPLPDYILSSPAARAQATTEAFIEAAGLEIEPQFEEGIYDASSAQLMKIVRSIPDTSSCALMVGHNPGFEETLARLTGKHERMPTAALACIELKVDGWEDVEDGAGSLVWLVAPKEL